MGECDCVVMWPVVSGGCVVMSGIVSGGAVDVSDHEQDPMKLNSLPPGRVDLDGTAVQIACGLQHTGLSLSLSLSLCVCVCVCLCLSVCETCE